MSKRFFDLSEDVILTIFFLLEEDPRDWASLACVCTRFSSLVRNICWKNKCYATIPSVVSDLISPHSSPGPWASLHKLSVCCPGLSHAGVLLEYSDFGLDRELGSDEFFRRSESFHQVCLRTDTLGDAAQSVAGSSVSDCCDWSVYDDLGFDTLHNVREVIIDPDTEMIKEEDDDNEGGEATVVKVDSGSKVGRGARSRSHLASGVWNLCREQGNKLLASRFRGDSLYICDWPGCVHTGKRRNYMLFRGIFRNFRGSRVWRAVKDANKSKKDLTCAFCPCKETWDLHSAFCLRRGVDFHEDGEPVVRAYVCENGHVSGAWTDLSAYT